MSEAIEVDARIQHIRNKEHVIKDEAQLSNVKNIADIAVKGVLPLATPATSGWLLEGTTADGRDTIVKLAKDPTVDATSDEDPGPHYEYNARLLKEASSRTYFVPLYYGHGAAEVQGLDGLFPYLSMEHIKGRTLEELMYRKEKNRDGIIETVPNNIIDIQTSLDILKTIATGVDEMLGDPEKGDKAIISTDLKPGNLMIRDRTITDDTQAEQPYSPVIIDLDMARKEGETIDIKEDKIRASLLYAGPEQIKNGSTVTRTLNTWQLGAIAFEMLIHEPFFNFKNQMPILVTYSDEREFNKFLEKRLKEVNLPSATQAVLARALSYNPKDRYQSATEFVEALDMAERTYVQFKRGVPKPLLSRRLQNERPNSHEHKDSSRPSPRREKYIGRHQTPTGGKHRRTRPTR